MYSGYKTAPNPSYMKMTRSILILLVMASAVIAAAQTPTDQKAKPYEPRKVVITPEPVTKKEAGKVLLQVDQAIVRVMPKLKLQKIGLSGNAPVTRAEIITEFDRIFQMAKPEFKFTPKKVAYDPKILTIKDKAANAKLQNLIAWGVVDRVGILATSPKETMGVLDFGDAVGFMTARVAELTHMPDPRFSPDLEAP